MLYCDADLATPVVIPAGTVADLELMGTLRSIGVQGRPERINQARYAVAGDRDEWITVGLRQPDPGVASGTTVDGRPALVETNTVAFLDGTGLFVETSEDVTLGVTITELAASLVVDSEFSWPSTPPLVSPSPDGAFFIGADILIVDRPDHSRPHLNPDTVTKRARAKNYRGSSGSPKENTPLPLPR